MMLAVLGPNTVLQVPVESVAFMVGSVLPLVTALVTTVHASARVKAIVNAVLAIAAGVGSAFIMGKGVLTVGQVFTAVMTAYTGAGVFHEHLWKPTGVSNSAANVAPGVGIGPSVTPPPLNPDLPPTQGFDPTAVFSPPSVFGPEVAGPGEDAGMAQLVKPARKPRARKTTA